MLAQSETIKGLTSGEFDVDITGVKTLRLAVICSGTSHASSSSAWANACVYSTAESNPLDLPDKPEITATVPGGDKEDPAEEIAPTVPDVDASDSQSSGSILGGVVAVLVIVACVVIYLISRKKKQAV